MGISGYANFKHKECRRNSIENAYLAGLWHNGILDQLLWVAETKPPPTRPSSYRCPTWSWGSINGPIQFLAEERKGRRDCAPEILSWFIATNPLNPFGTLLKSPTSYLRAKGFLKPVRGIEIPSKEAPMPTQAAFRRAGAQNWWIEFDVIDVHERMEQAVIERSEVDFFEQHSLYCLRMTEFTALLLVPVSIEKGIPRFERVGIVRHWQRERWTWFDDLEERKELFLL